MKKGHGRLARAIGGAGGKTAHLREKLRHRRFDDNSKWTFEVVSARGTDFGAKISASGIIGKHGAG
jgi:hypothetical protein